MTHHVQPTFRRHHYSQESECLVNEHGDRVQIRPKSLAVFIYLAERPSKVVSKDELLDHVWAEVLVTDDVLVKSIGDIRQVLGDKDRTTLQTISGRGYLIEPDDVPQTLEHPLQNIFKNPRSRWPLLIPLLLLLGLSFYPYEEKAEENTVKGIFSETGTPTISIAIEENTTHDSFLESVESETRIALSRYKSMIVIDNDHADFTLKLSEKKSDTSASISLEMLKSSSKELVYAETLEQVQEPSCHEPEPSTAACAKSLGIRVAGIIASPGGGAISRYLLESSKNKKAEQLTRAECYAYGYDCTNCSGELDTITEKAEQCLTKILREDPKDARAWGLQSTIYAHQFLWSTTLGEPERSTRSARLHLPSLAIEAANKAEQYSDGTDTSVYWGMAQAYGADCQIEKLRTVIDRGLQINPDDPSLLASFGGWLAYAGEWDDGVAMVERALEIEPRYYKHWWLFPIAKQYYAKGEYESALKVFRRAYNERNWLSHLQLAYTLPHLGRLEEAIEERKIFERMLPSATVENAMQFYKSFCFEDSFVEKIQWALLQAGLPSRGQSDDYDDIRPSEAKVVSVNGFNLEYMDVGRGTPIVFVHGSISDYRAWSHFQNPISENHRYISYSRRYTGSQEWPDNGEKFGIETDANDLIAFIEHLNIGPVFVVTWSRGGRVAGLATVKRPDLFQGAIHYEPISPVLDNTTNPVEVNAREAFFARFDDSSNYFASEKPDKAVAVILENVFELERGRFDTEIMPMRKMVLDSANMMILQREKDRGAKKIVDCELLSQSTVPTLVIEGEKTHAWWKHIIRRYHDCTPDSEITIMDGVNHDGPVRQPEKLTELIVKFVSRHKQQHK